MSNGPPKPGATITALVTRKFVRRLCVQKASIIAQLEVARTLALDTEMPRIDPATFDQASYSAWIGARSADRFLNAAPRAA